MALEPDYHVATFVSAEPAIEAVKSEPPDLILLDVGLPGMNGIEALKEIRDICPDVVVIMITAYEDVNTVISAMKLGAFDYVVKPIHMDGLMVTIVNGLESIRLRKEVQALQERYLMEHLPCFIGESNAIQDVMEFIGMVAKSSDTPILIVGETGVGKELIAGAIHFRSPNFKGPLITVNCAGIPNELIESELFGYEKGAFTGAGLKGKKGLVEEAANGTLFLDEVGDLSLQAQAKLLRFLQDGGFYKIGGTRKTRIQTRVVSATNKDLEQMIEKELFRRDLYYRLGVIKVRVPSLNERQGDIIPLAQYFTSEFARKFGKDFIAVSPRARELLLSRNWTGNVRELRNVIERGVLVGSGPELMVRDLGIGDGISSEMSDKITGDAAFPPVPPGGIDFASLEESFEKFYLDQAFKMAGGNESKAARLLNMNHHTFRYRRKKFFS